MESLYIRVPEFDYHDLHNPHKLARLTDIFYDEVLSADPGLFERFDRYRIAKGEGLTGPEISSIVVEMAPYLSRFVVRMFGIEDECSKLRLQAEKEEVIFRFKKDFFVRRVLKKFSKSEADAVQLRALDGQIAALATAFPDVPSGDPELTAAAIVLKLVGHETALKGPREGPSLEFLRALCARLKQNDLLHPSVPPLLDEEELKLFVALILSWYEQWLAAHFYAGTPAMSSWATFRIPGKVEYESLVDYKTVSTDGVAEIIGHEASYRHRDGFDLTDPRYSRRDAMSEVDYCILCHERDKDSCSKGFKEKESFKRNPLGFTLEGCPLDQKISESHLVESRGDVVGALAIIMIDNPMCPGTGHRICNDCMKGCIYQKQDPVNIPQVETRVLTDVLNLPWGFEIYSLFTRWNPLNIERPYPLAYNAKNVLVVGMGPAGYTMAHYLLNEGFGVVGIDGLKIEPLQEELVGSPNLPFEPVRDYSSLCSNLSDRVLLGFGGVSEYGITVRWDKNFLTVIYLNLLRRTYFSLYDGVRFGGTLTVEDAWDMGFHHVCFATGAGKPTFVTMENNLIRGIRKASDILMALQLTGAGKRDSLANLQIRLPVIVIGGGLTAIDTATEVMAYYPVQVEKIRQRYDLLCARYGRDAVDRMFSAEETGILNVFLEHANAIEAERRLAAANGRSPDFISLMRSWGGVHIYYRKRLNDAPAYRLNHEEIIKGLEEGISIVDKMNPLEAVPDEFGAVKGLLFEQMAVVDGKWKATGAKRTVPARTVLVAAGTVPNIMYEKEHPATFQLDEWGEFFQSFTVTRNAKTELMQTKKGEVGFFTSYQKEGKYVSFYGDNHPVFEGNVVKAMASAKAGYKKVVALFDQELGRAGEKHEQDLDPAWWAFRKSMEEQFKASVVRVERLTPTIVEVVVHAPLAARKFQPGQFFRLQNYEVDSPRLESTLLMMEGVALTGAWVDVDKGWLSMIILEMGASSRLCSALKPGQRVVVMGPTGAPTEIPPNSTALLLGGGLGNAVLFSIAKAFKEKNGRVIYFAGYKRKEDFFKRAEIEASTDIVVYSVDSGPAIETRRPQDKSFVGNIIEAMAAYAKGRLGQVGIPLSEASRVIAIGSDRMMAAVTAARHTVLKPYLHEDHVGIASINSPMQCMMKAICAQCLQRHIDKETGKEEFVFTCVNQDQCMDDIDFEHLSSRLRANTVLEKISNRWLDYIFEKHSIARA